MLNHISIMGRLTRDPELRYTTGGTAVASFTLAVDRDYMKDGQRDTDFIDVAAWGTTGEFVSKYFHKGNMMVVSGRLQSLKWQDREGNNRTNWEVKADGVYFTESKKSESTNESNSYDNSYNHNASSGGFYEVKDKDELPF